MRIINSKTTTSFKKRNLNKVIKQKLNYGKCGIIFLKNYNLEIIYFFNFKKKIKLFLKKRKFWILLSKNYPISRKSKNARMGKGKGGLARVVYKVPSNKTWLEIKEKNPYVCHKIINYFQKKNNLHTQIIYKI